MVGWYFLLYTYKADAIKILTTLQRQNTEISKQIFPEKEYWGFSPNFHIHASVSNLYFSTIGLPILLEEICRPILGLYKSLTDAWMLKLGLRLRLFPKREYIYGIFVAVYVYCSTDDYVYLVIFIYSANVWNNSV